MKGKKNQGFALMEIVVATALISMLTLALVSVTQKSLELSNRALDQAQASFLLEEGAEVVKIIRDDSWSYVDGLTIDTEYYLYYDTNIDKWSLSSTPNQIDGFTRKVVIDNAYRDGANDLAESGTIDDYGRQVNIEVSWNSMGTQLSKELSFYIFDLFS